MEHSPMPMDESERRGMGRDLNIPLALAAAQGLFCWEADDGYTIFDLDPPEKFLPVEGEDD